MAELTEYLWIVIVGFFFGFAYAFGIGANDVANAFASTVASKSLTLKQAIIVAGIFEFLGALLLGAAVTGTIRNKIFDPEIYEDQPDIVLLGMFTAIMTGTLMLFIATYYGMPVSTTHTIVGSIMGFSIAAEGFTSINWDVVVKIAISWIISPLVSGVIGFIFFFLIKHFVMTRENPFQRAYYTFPIILTIFIGVDLFYVLYKGFNNAGFTDDLPLSLVLPVGFGAGFFFGLLWIWPWGPFTKRRINSLMDDKDNAAAENQEWDEVDMDGDGAVTKVKVADEEEDIDVESPDVIKDNSEETTPEEVEEESKGFSFKKSLKKFAESTYEQDLHSQSMHESSRAAEIWEDTVMYDEKAEFMFTYVQVFTACLNSFAHGANDVANAIAPLSAILNIYQTGMLNEKSPVQKWILAYGGIGIVIGLLLYGYKVMKSLGFKICALSPSRGASAELAASLFVVTASFLAIPVSSTQSIVGAVTGVGLVSGHKNVDWWFFGKVCLGWITVFVSAVIISAGLFAMFAYSPSLTVPMVLNITTS